MDEEKKSSKGKKFFPGFIAGVIIMLIIFGVVYGIQAAKSGNMSSAKIKTAVTNFINQSATPGQPAATVDSIANYNCGLYKMQISLGDQKAEAYVTKDGKKIFPAAIDMVSTSTATNNTNGQTAQTPANVNKNNKPVVELFVMSYCPYGTQIEKGIIPAVQALGNKIDFSIKFVNYAMHGKNEVDENLRQYCIQKDQNSKYLNYLTCFLKASDSASCLSSAGIDQNKLNSCVSSADKQFKITANFNDKSTWIGDYPPFNVNASDNQKYGVQGSPTLVINGTVVDSARDSAGLLTAICGAFNTAPDACTKSNLSSATPAPGFGEGTTAGSASANCATPTQ